MKPLVTTMFMALLAFATSMAAWYYYPRIEVQQDEVDRVNLLTEDEVFDSRDVRLIKIEQYDRTGNTREDFELQFVNGSWVIPGSFNYPADNLERVAKATNALRDKKILETVSDKKDDHEQYGVLEIDEMGSSRLGAGTVFTFEGRNRKKLGKLIVGTSPDGKPDQRYVRLAGQPKIYVIEFDKDLLTTKFSDWVDGSLIRIGGNQMQPEQFIGQVKAITIDLYFEKQKSTYRAVVRPTAKGWFYDLWKANDKGGLPDDPSQTNLEAERITLSNLVSTIFHVIPQGVLKKQDSAAADLAAPSDKQPASHFKSLEDYGFYHRGFENGQHQFDSAAGQITISYQFGLETKVNIGSLDIDVANGGTINRYVMMTSYVNPSLLPEPRKSGKPGGGSENPDEADSESTQETSDDTDREFQARQKQRQDILNAAEKMATSYNQVHADWIYVFPEQAIQRLLPPMESLKKSSN